MGTGEGLADGARVTVVGGIIAAVAFAAALGIAGRLRGRTFSIHVHDGEGSQASRGPVLLTPACRMHLSALGCRVPAEWCQRRFSGVELHQGERVHALPSPPAPSWWLPDSAPLRQALAASASVHGAVFLGRRVEAWHRSTARDDEGARRGQWVARGAGRSDRYHTVVLSAEGRLAAGAAALGSLLEHGLTPLLESCSSAAHALVAHSPDSAAMVHAHGVEGLRAAALRARDAASAVQHLHRAGPAALDAFAAAAEATTPWGATTPGTLGLPSPAPCALGAAARAARMRLQIRELPGSSRPALPRPRPVGAVPHLLVVEPNANRALRLAGALAARGVTTTVLVDGLAVLREMGARWPTAIVLGRHLPWMDPLSLCEALRAHPGGATLPVVVLGDEALGEARRVLARLGAVWLSGAEAEPDSVARLLVPEVSPAAADLVAAHVN